MSNATAPKKPRGPEPERVKIHVDHWADAVAHALQKPMPPKKKAAKVKKSK